jgi:1-acyl-sn-glycerol-3-phosphate acyltransferase
MLSKILPAPLRGILSFLIYIINTLFWCALLFPVAIVKFIIPVASWRRHCNRALTYIADHWILVNNINQRIFSHTNWDVRGVDSLERNSWYMVVANHQSWVDILVLQNIFYRRIPFLKFFLKKELIWFPILGQAWWALDFPFMKRYSRAHLKRYPHHRGKDLEITRKACRKFKTMPVSIMNFVEGTRFSTEKHKQQRSPYQYLLRSKAGGIAFVLGAMGDQMHRLLDVTIVYPKGPVNFWQYLCGNVKEIKVQVRSLPIGRKLTGDYFYDKEYHREFQAWLNNLWQEKDYRINAMLSK